MSIITNRQAMVIIGSLLVFWGVVIFFSTPSNAAEISRQHVCQTLADDITRLYKRRHELAGRKKDQLNRYDYNDVVIQLNAAINSWTSIDRFCLGHIIDILERADNELHEHKTR